MIEQLRQSLRALEKPAMLEAEAGCLPLGVAAIDATLGGGLVRGALHEVAAAGEAHLAAATGFAVGLAALSPSWPGLCRSSTSFNRTDSQAVDARHKVYTRAGHWPDPGAGHDGRGRNVVWIAEDMALTESGMPYGPGLEAFGLRPERLLTVAAAHRRDLLWAMEEALRCRTVNAVIGELRAGEIDSVAVRRLSLAAGESGALAFLLRTSPPHDASTAATRWIVGAAPSACFTAQLTRNRRGPLGSWILQWSNDDERFVLATHAQPVAAPAADRPHRQVA
jgi:protein ImuA